MRTEFSEYQRRLSAHPKGFAFTQECMINMLARGSITVAQELAEQTRNPQVVARIKASVAAGGTQPGSWGAPLASPTHASEFIGLLRPASVVGRMLGTRPAPFNVEIPRQTAGAVVGWIGQDRPNVVGELALDIVSLGIGKIGGIVVFTEPLMRFSEPACVAIVQADLIAAISQFTDQQFLDPNVAEVADVSPASITYGQPAFVSTGSGAAQVESDLKLLVESLNGSGALFRNPYFVMLPRTALHLATLRDTNGVRTFPGVNVTGGEIWGIPVLVSANMPVEVSTGDPSFITLIDASEILLAEGGIEMDTSRNAAIQMRTDPQTGAQTLVSLWQHNLVGARVLRAMRWQLRRPGAVALLTDVVY